MISEGVKDSLRTNSTVSAVILILTNNFIFEHHFNHTFHSLHKFQIQPMTEQYCRASSFWGAQFLLHKLNFTKISLTHDFFSPSSHGRGHVIRHVFGKRRMLPSYYGLLFKPVSSVYLLPSNQECIYIYIHAQIHRSLHDKIPLTNTHHV